MSVKMRSSEEVELNLASMLDMAFQLLAFFILTFQSPAPEAQILMRMPPPQAVIGLGKEAAGENTDKDPTTVKPATTLVVSVLSKNGGIDIVQVGVPSLAPMKTFESNHLTQLNEELVKFFKQPGFEQVIVQASPELHYGELMRVVEVCAKQTFADGTLLGKLSFVALPPNQM
ncbi:MAG: biopolymer transporter ExbD [Thermoguttaceae bacterium]